MGSVFDQALESSGCLEAAEQSGLSGCLGAASGCLEAASGCLVAKSLQRRPSVGPVWRRTLTKVHESLGYGLESIPTHCQQYGLVPTYRLANKSLRLARSKNSWL